MTSKILFIDSSLNIKINGFSNVKTKKIIDVKILCKSLNLNYL